MGKITVNRTMKKENRKGKRKTRMKSRKKAFLFTLGLLITTLAILSFTKFAFTHSEQEKIIFQTAAISYRLDDTDNSLQESIKKTFELHSNIEAYFDNSTAVFEEPLPNSPDVFESKLSSLATLAEANDTSIYIEVNETAETMPITILPQNVTYAHNFSSREITISTGSTNSTISRLRTTITVSENITCDWLYTPGDFSYELDVVSPKDSGCDHDRMISAGAVITIADQIHGSNRITITISGNSTIIRMDESSEFSAVVKNEMYFPYKPLQAWLSGNLIQIEYDSFRLRRQGGARII